MENPTYPRNIHILPSNVPSAQSLAPHHNIPRTVRQPLSDSNGNSHYHNLASTTYYDLKPIQTRPEHAQHRPSLPIVPSQPARPIAANTLELRRNHTRRLRQARSVHNPIRESQQYQNYRSRVTRDGPEDSKWPEDLENDFLDGESVVCWPSVANLTYC